jgi:hypothetical protein
MEMVLGFTPFMLPAASMCHALPVSTAYRHLLLGISLAGVEEKTSRREMSFHPIIRARPLYDFTHQSEVQDPLTDLPDIVFSRLLQVLSQLAVFGHSANTGVSWVWRLQLSAAYNSTRVSLSRNGISVRRTVMMLWLSSSTFPGHRIGFSNHFPSGVERMTRVEVGMAGELQTHPSRWRSLMAFSQRIASMVLWLTGSSRICLSCGAMEGTVGQSLPKMKRSENSSIFGKI